MNPEAYKFQNLEVYRLGLDYLQAIYSLSKKLPSAEYYNLKSQVERAATSIVLNIAEGSIGQTNQEQKRFLTIALRSYIETIACLDIMERQGYQTAEEISPIRQQGYTLFIKLQAFRRSISTRHPSSVSGLRSKS